MNFGDDWRIALGCAETCIPLNEHKMKSRNPMEIKRSLVSIVATCWLASACGGTPTVGKGDRVGEDGGTDGTGGGLPDGGMGNGGGLDETDILTSDGTDPVDQDAGSCDETTGLGCDYGDAGPACGDGELADSEQCDDGNGVPGDGCNGVCRLEPNSVCEEPGQPCESTIECGDARLDPGEFCDDGNVEDGDGCSADCSEQDPAYVCPPGELCRLLYDCGDGRVNGEEECDDGNEEAGDGCDESCALEDGYLCRRPGQACTKDERCGDGILNGVEECDDGNTSWGDGCSGICLVDPYWICEEEGEACEYTIICGNGEKEIGEVCDDGNTEDGDGCSADCLTQSVGYVCPPGEACEQLYTCGDGRVSQITGEECDDGASASPGCDAECQLEDGYTCPTPGAACIVVTYCGDGALQAGEQCDDGDNEPGDGCSAECRIETDWACDSNGQNCEYTVECGDGVVNGAEACDDENTEDGDGCSSDCTEVEEGFTCARAGFACRAICGDGVVLGNEQCDDGPGTLGAPGTPVGGDGCSAGCLREPSHACPPAGGACTETVCGNGPPEEGDEGCDDGNTTAGDGCGPTCQSEPIFDASGVPNLECGDGLLTGGEDCDDGNAADGDGCSSSCEVEPGWECEELSEFPESVQMAVTYRDFIASAASGGHPDFQRDGTDSNIAGAPCTTANQDTCGQLDAQRKPQLDGSHPTVQSADSFALWYRDTDPAGDVEIEVIDGSLLLQQDPVVEDRYVFSSAAFFPLNGIGHNADGSTSCGEQNGGCCGGVCAGRNYHFTTELRYFFQYQGGETLEFHGDDDVFVFINGRAAVDISGIHCAEVGRVVLGDEDSTCSIHGVDYDGGADCAEVGTVPACGAADYTPAEQADNTDDRFGLTKGGVYEIVLFHAERNYQYSNFRLTLQGFLPPRSFCSPVCGDGIPTSNEECDDGTPDAMSPYDEEPNNTPTPEYDSCTADVCTLGPYCKDGNVDVSAGEECDNGNNVDGWGDTDEEDCAPGCVTPPYCGDGNVDSPFEECDDGTGNSDTGYDGCTTGCLLGPRCGDGSVNGDEGCDDGINDGTYGSCTPDCEPGPRCGDGMLQADWGEECDGGDDCTDTCRLIGTCGDAIVQPELGEECDDGVNAGGYGLCAPECVLGPRCGDEVVQDQEQCDNGEEGNVGGYDACDEFCQYGPYCGDGVVNGDETCDDGINDNFYGSCTEECGLGPRCGDGTIQEEWGEECDGGENCSENCRLGAQCGDTVVQEELGEECDDGVNDGGYGECGPMCTYGPRCGDGVRDPENEQCDDGENDGGYGECAANCRLGPRCGDGKVNGPEQCDDGNTEGSDGCSAVCRWERNVAR